MFGILYGMALGGFSLPTDEQIRFASYRSGVSQLLFFLRNESATDVPPPLPRLPSRSFGSSSCRSWPPLLLPFRPTVSCTPPRVSRRFSRFQRPNVQVLTRLLPFAFFPPALSAKIRSQSFAAILRSDVAWFDEEKNSVSDASRFEGPT